METIAATPPADSGLGTPDSQQVETATSLAGPSPSPDAAAASASPTTSAADGVNSAAVTAGGSVGTGTPVATHSRRSSFARFLGGAFGGSSPFIASGEGAGAGPAVSIDANANAAVSASDVETRSTIPPSSTQPSQAVSSPPVVKPRIADPSNGSNAATDVHDKQSSGPSTLTSPVEIAGNVLRTAMQTLPLF